jgi:hypothetical protein
VPPFGNVEFGVPQPFGAPPPPQQPITTFDWPGAVQPVPPPNAIPTAPPIAPPQVEPAPADAPIPAAPTAQTPVVGPETALPEVKPPEEGEPPLPNDLAIEAPPMPVEPQL